uniref:Uncharacterized protein n=1 Tax=Fervidobacterium pennivorans TaxID=93466 RepID=A0A7C4VV84_FERPE
MVILSKDKIIKERIKNFTKIYNESTIDRLENILREYSSKKNSFKRGKLKEDADFVMEIAASLTTLLRDCKVKNKINDICRPFSRRNNWRPETLSTRLVWLTRVVLDYLKESQFAVTILPLTITRQQPIESREGQLFNVKILVSSELPLPIEVDIREKIPPCFEIVNGALLWKGELRNEPIELKYTAKCSEFGLF